MLRIEYCPKCGEKIPKVGAYCSKCGYYVQSSYQRERYVHWKRRSYDNVLWGLISIAGFLIVLGLTISAYPDLFSRVVSYLMEFGTYAKPVLPPYSLGQPLMHFLNLSGIWGVVFGAIRLAVGHSPREAIGNITWSPFAFYLAYMLSQFFNQAFRGSPLVLFAIFGAVVFMIVNAITRSAVRSSFR